MSVAGVGCSVNRFGTRVPTRVPTGKRVLNRFDGCKLACLPGRSRPGRSAYSRQTEVCYRPRIRAQCAHPPVQPLALLTSRCRRNDPSQSPYKFPAMYTRGLTGRLAPRMGSVRAPTSARTEPGCAATCQRSVPSRKMSL
jgi:hypothetical protein